MGFSSLQHSRVRRSTCRGLCLPATFRPQGLVTLSAAYSLRARAGFISHRRRSWDSPFGAFSSRKVPARFRTEGPTYRFSLPVFPTLSRWAGPASLGFWALTLPEVPGDRTAISTSATGCSLGFCPSRVCRRAALPGLSPKLLPRTSTNAALRRHPPVPRSLDRLPPGLFRSARQAERTGPGNPSRVSAPERSRAFERVLYPGYGFASCRAVHHCRQTSTLWTESLALPEPLGTA